MRTEFLNHTLNCWLFSASDNVVGVIVWSAIIIHTTLTFIRYEFTRWHSWPVT